MNASQILNDIATVTKKWTKQRKAEIKRASASSRRAYLYRSSRITVKQAAWETMEAAYMKTSSDGALPAHARQVMYAARDYIQKRTNEILDDKYFTQTLLPDYITEHGRDDWDVVFDARGHFYEPHTGREIPLGTLEVRQYLSGKINKPLTAPRWQGEIILAYPE